MNISPVTGKISYSAGCSNVVIHSFIHYQGFVSTYKELSIILGNGEAAVNETEENPYVHEMYALTAGHQQHQ